VLQRLTAFLRSVIPADPWQLLFFVGVIFLFISPRLPWWPTTGGFSADLYSPRVLIEGQTHFWCSFAFFAWPLILASLVGYYSCFFPGPRPTRGILLAVFPPTVFGLPFVLYGYFDFLRSKMSVLLTTIHPSSGIYWIVSNIWHLSTGFSFCVLSLLFIAIFTVRLVRSHSSLPLALPDSSHTYNDDPASWPRVRLLIFVLICPQVLSVSFISSYLGHFH
jgi:hypothetical protein